MISASLAAVKSINDGSFFLPLFGTGAPVPNRGKKNEPSFIDFTAAKLAEIKEISKSKLIEITTNNYNKLFFN